MGTITQNIGQALRAGAGLGYFVAAGFKSLIRTMQDKLAERVSIDDYASLADLLAEVSIAGAEGTGYGARPVMVDLLGKEVFGAGVVYLPMNVKFYNGTLNGTFVYRNPFVAAPQVRAAEAYWPWMKAGARDVAFKGKLVLNCYLNANFDHCDMSQAELVLVNSQGYWTEYNKFHKCFVVKVTFDGNLTGKSSNATAGTAGTDDGSFGYNNFSMCKGESTGVPAIALVDGASWYNSDAHFHGYPHTAGVALIDVGGEVVDGQGVITSNAAKIANLNFRLNLESFGVAAAIIKLGKKARMWYCRGSISTVSGMLTFIQDATADLRGNDVTVTGAVLQDKAGATVYQGDQYVSTITTHLLKRLNWKNGDTTGVDSLVASTQVSAPTVIASTALESRVPATGQITMRPNDNRAAASRNAAFVVNRDAFGDVCMLVSTTNANDPSVTVWQWTPAGMGIKAGFGCNGKAPQASVALPVAANDLSTAIGLVNTMRAALIANGIGV
jgi:hypothetical protein